MLRRTLAFLSLVAIAGCVEQSPDMPTEDDIKAAKEHILAQAPATMKYTVNADLEGKVTYLGMDCDSDTITPGKAFTLTHYWKVNEAVSEDWKLFIHLDAPNHSQHLNADHVPINGHYPVHAWKKGDIIRDIHRVSVPAGWRGSSVDIYVGLWKGPLRMKVTAGPHDNENRIKVASIPTLQKPVEPKRLVAKKVKAGSIKLDGKLDDAAWKDAPSTGLFVTTSDGSAAPQKTEAKLLWDDKYLYVAWDMEDKDVWTTLDKRDDKLWTQEAVEMFIDADGDGKTYLELQTNPKGAIFDSWLPAYRKNENDFDAGMKVAVKVDGTLEKRDDTDKGWTVEMQIPLEAARGKEKTMKNVPPHVGDAWRVNFFRMDQPAGKPQQASAWSPPMVGDFHQLDKFGTLVFGDEKGAAPALVAQNNVKAAASEKPATPEKSDKAAPSDEAKKPATPAMRPMPHKAVAVPPNPNALGITE